MEERKVHLISKVSDYFRARVWLRDYTIARNSSCGNRTVLMDAGDRPCQEIFCSFLNGSITPMDKLAP